MRFKLPAHGNAERPRQGPPSYLTRETIIGCRPVDGADTSGGVFRPGESLIDSPYHPVHWPFRHVLTCLIFWIKHLHIPTRCDKINTIIRVRRKNI